jgi:hypothetical protein
MSSALRLVSTSQGPCPPGTSWSVALGIWSIEGRARSAVRYGAHAPQMNIVPTYLHVEVTV